MHSKDYQEQLRQLHAGRPAEKKWGTTGRRNFGHYVSKYVNDHNGWIRSVLDFGAGQRTMGDYVLSNNIVDGLEWTDYDPGIPGIDGENLLDREYDLVVSSDVLEHVEPDMVAGTIRQLSKCARKAQYHHIACDPCGLILPDGRNAHLTVMPPDWWRVQMEVDGWQIQYFADRLERKRGGLRRSCHILLER